MRMKDLVWAVVAAASVLAPVASGAKDWTHVRVGIEGAFPPWNSMNSQGQLAGLDVDLIADLCKRADLECELLPGEWSAMIPGLNAGKFDVLMTLGINEERRKVVDFSIPYASGAGTFLVLKDGPVTALPMTGKRLDLRDAAKADPVLKEIGAALAGKTVGVVQSTSQQKLIEARYGDAVDVRTYKNSGERDLDLKSGRIDVGFDSAVYASFELAKPGNGDIAMAGPLMRGAPLATDVALGLRKGEDDLKAKFDEAIRGAAGDGTIKALSEKWSRLDLTPAP